MHVIVSQDMLRRTRHCLKQALPGIGSSHAAEALAAALGFDSNVAFRTWLSTPRPAEALEMDMAAFGRKLGTLGHPGRVADIVTSDNRCNPKTRIAEGVFDALDPAVVQQALLDVVRRELRGDDRPQWEERIGILLDAVLALARWRHGADGRSFSQTGFRSCITLEALSAASALDSGVPDQVRSAITRYLGQLPGFNPVCGAQQLEVPSEQHRYPAMLVWLASQAGVLRSLREGSVSFVDPSRGTRIEIVMLPPPLETDPALLISLKTDSSDWLFRNSRMVAGADRVEKLDPQASVPLVFWASWAAEYIGRNRSTLSELLDPHVTRRLPSAILDECAPTEMVSLAAQLVTYLAACRDFSGEQGKFDMLQLLAMSRVARTDPPAANVLATTLFRTAKSTLIRLLATDTENLDAQQAAVRLALSVALERRRLVPDPAFPPKPATSEEVNEMDRLVEAEHAQLASGLMRDAPVAGKATPHP